MTAEQIEAAARVLLADYESQYDASHLTWHEFADLAARVLEAAANAVPLVSGQSEMLKAAPVKAIEPLRVRVVIEDDGGNDLWWFYPVRPVHVGDHVRLDFDVKMLET